MQPINLINQSIILSPAACIYHMLPFLQFSCHKLALIGLNPQLSIGINSLNNVVVTQTTDKRTLIEELMYTADVRSYRPISITLIGGVEAS